jgi:predicted nucleic acid-binding protein
MKYLFDTNIISDLYDTSTKQHLTIIERLNTLSDLDSLAISIVTLYELEYACANAPDDKKVIIRNDINHLKANFEVAPLSIVSAEMFGVLKKQFKDSRMISKENIKKHNIDIMLASCAICDNYTMVSADKIFPVLKQFYNGLYIEDWTIR